MKADEFVPAQPNLLRPLATDAVDLSVPVDRWHGGQAKRTFGNSASSRSWDAASAGAEAGEWADELVLSVVFAELVVL